MDTFWVGLRTSLAVVQSFLLSFVPVSQMCLACLGSGSSYARPLVEILLAKGDLSVNQADKTIAPIFSFVSNVQTTVGEGVDVCIFKDEKGIESLVHREEVDLGGLRQAILEAMGVKS